MAGATELPPEGTYNTPGFIKEYFTKPFDDYSTHIKEEFVKEVTSNQNLRSLRKIQPNFAVLEDVEYSEREPVGDVQKVEGKSKATKH